MAENIDLHDATLVTVLINWADGTCLAEIRHGELGMLALTFSTVSSLTLPRRQSWGRSESINSFSMPTNGRYEIEMQSGDLITIEATEMMLSTAAQG
jgi:hypothetical protein